MAGTSNTMSGHGQTALLLRDTHGDKIGAWYFGYRKKKDHPVLRGTILQPILVKDSGMSPDGKPAVNYKVYNEEVLLYCDGIDVVPLTNHEFSLVIGIRERDARYRAFVNDSLEWGVKLKVGCKVFVALPSKLALATHHSCQAVIRWIGALPGEEGLKFGVEITDEGCYGAGSTDGFFRGNQLFKCRENNGLFVALDKLSISADPSAPNEPSSLQNNQPSSRLGLKQTSDPKLSDKKPDRVADNTRSRKMQPGFKFAMHDRVIVHNKDQIAIHGTVRWLGHANTEPAGQVKAIGIETDVSVNKTDFVFALTGLKSNFSCTNSRHGKIVLPEEMVQAEAEAAEEKQRAQESARRDPHAGIDKDQERELREAKVESVYMNRQEQERMIKKYNDEQQQNRNAGRSSTPQRGAGDHGQNSPPKRANHPYEAISETVMDQSKANLSHHSGSTGALQRYNSSPATGSRNVVEDELRRAAIDTREIDHSEQARMLAVYKKKQDEERKQHPSGYPAPTWANNGSSVDNSSTQNSDVYQNVPAKAQATPGTKAIAPKGPAHNFRMGSKVEFSDPPRFGVIQWMGELPECEGMMAGVELDLPFEGCSDGIRGGQRYFKCKPGHAFFCPVTTLRPDRREAAPTKAGSNTPPIAKPRQQPTDPSNHHRHHPPAQLSDNPAMHAGQYGHNPQQDQQNVTYPGTGQAVQNPGQPSAPGYHSQATQHPGYQGQPHRSTYQPANISQPPQVAQAGYNPPYGQLAIQSTYPTQPNQNVPPPSNGQITEGSAVEFGDPTYPYHGVVRWIGPIYNEVMAGVELDNSDENCGDGIYHGVRYFKCENGKAYFCNASYLRPDSRILEAQPYNPVSNINPLQTPWEEQEDQQVPYSTVIYLGDRKGIQGNQNSCYLDSTLFGLFAMSDIFDEMFLDEKLAQTIDVNRRAISEMLWKGIVNPLRKYGVVRFESVMRMRNKLDDLGKMEGIAEKEKDPEEFLNMLFKHVLKVPAFISIRRPFGVEPEFFVQLFIEPDPNTKVPFVGNTLRKMYTEQKISFVKVPSKLLLQVPRFGREFKTYEKMVPDLKLDISSITDAYTQNAPVPPSCMFCGEKSDKQCKSCIKDFSATAEGGFVFFCDICYSRAHQHKDRSSHQPMALVKQSLSDDELSLYQLDLLSVICIETSHYVCFTRDLHSESWIFFDSMADREFDTYNIPRVTDCTQELNEWVYARDLTKLKTTPPKQLPQLVRRFTQDVYMCVYVQPDIAMYGDQDALASLHVQK